MSVNMATKALDPTTILRSLISPRVSADLLQLTDEEIVAEFATVSETYGLKESYIRATWRQLALRISAAISRRNSPDETT